MTKIGGKMELGYRKCNERDSFYSIGSVSGAKGSQFRRSRAITDVKCPWSMSHSDQGRTYGGSLDDQRCGTGRNIPYSDPFTL